MMKAFYSTTAHKAIKLRRNRSFIIHAGKDTPFVQFDGKNGTLTIHGNSTDLTITNQLVSLVTLVDAYLETNDQLTCTLMFNNINASTCKVLFNLFKVLQHHKQNEKTITVNWLVLYDYDEMIYTGLDFAGIFDLDFNVEYTSTTKQLAC